MAITADNIKIYLSENGYGGAIAGEMGTNVHALFDLITSAELQAGETEYRCVYVKNTHEILTMQASKIWIPMNAVMEIRLATSDAAINAVEIGSGSFTLAPIGRTWLLADSEISAIALGDITPGGYKAIFLRRTVPALSVAVTADGITLRIKCDTEA